jgi:hypothetical protein
MEGFIFQAVFFARSGSISSWYFGARNFVKMQCALSDTFLRNLTLRNFLMCSSLTTCLECAHCVWTKFNAQKYQLDIVAGLAKKTAWKKSPSIRSYISCETECFGCFPSQWFPLYFLWKCAWNHTKLDPPSYSANISANTSYFLLQFFLLESYPWKVHFAFMWTFNVPLPASMSNKTDLISKICLISIPVFCSFWANQMVFSKIASVYLWK